ncbi:MULTISPECIES: hypothetical protein [Paenibacillus]|nr:hypothetical protein [Paenibacillus odorifer]
MVTERKSKLGVNDSGSVGVKVRWMITERKSKLGVNDSGSVGVKVWR